MLNEEQDKELKLWIKHRRESEEIIRSRAKLWGSGHTEIADELAVITDAVEYLYQEYKARCPNNS
jgi:orotate phosphoribosyltransferase-like protein